MTTNVITIDVKRTVLEAAKLMHQQDVGDLVVMEGVEAKGIVTGKNLLSVERERWKTAGLGSGSQNEFVPGDLQGFAIVQLRGNQSLPFNSAPAPKIANFMVMEQVKYALGLILDYFLFARHQPLHIGKDFALQPETEFVGSVKFIQQLGRGDHDFGRNTAPVEAGSSHVVPLNDRDLCPQLGGTDGCHISPRPRSDDNHSCRHNASPSVGVGFLLHAM